MKIIQISMVYVSDNSKVYLYGLGDNGIVYLFNTEKCEWKVVVRSENIKDE